MEIKDITEAVVDTAQNVRNVATGAAVQAAEMASNPTATARREANRLKTKGAHVNRRIDRETEKAVDGIIDAAEAMLPERMALQGLSLVKARARRVDLVGEVAYRSLRLVNGTIQGVIGTLNRFEKATTPPARPSRSVSRAAGTSATQTKTAVRSAAKKTARTATKTAARAAGSTTRTTRTATTRTKRTARTAASGARRTVRTARTGRAS